MNYLNIKKIEITWCALPAVSLVSIVGPSFSLVYSLDPYIDPALTIKVIGHQWYWSYELAGIYKVDTNSVYYKKTDSFKSLEVLMEKRKQDDFFSRITYEEMTHFLQNLRYNQDVIHFDFSFDSSLINENELEAGAHRLLEVDNRLVVPVGVPIRFIITSTDVLHSWSVPALGIKVDAVPGRLNQFVVEIKKPGIFYGQCSELCGPLHGFMPIVVQSVSDSEFETWLFSKANI